MNLTQDLREAVSTLKELLAKFESQGEELREVKANCARQEAELREVRAELEHAQTNQPAQPGWLWLNPTTKMLHVFSTASEYSSFLTPDAVEKHEKVNRSTCSRTS